MAETVVVIARQSEQVRKPEPERHPRIGIVAAEDENECMHEDQPVEQRRQRKAAPGRDHDRQADHDRRYLHAPGQAIVRRDPRIDEVRQHQSQQQQ
jgi:hypothetical protein